MTYWKKLSKDKSNQLADIRSQLHKSTQLVALAARGQLPESKEDKYASLIWNTEKKLLVSQFFGDQKNIQTAIDFSSFSLVVLVEEIIYQSFDLNNKTIDEALNWLKGVLQKLLIDTSSLSLKLPYKFLEDVLPGDQLHIENTDISSELTIWFDNTFNVLNSFKQNKSKTPDIWIWPHHFDIAMLWELPEGKSIGMGLSPGDKYIANPYYYISPYPYPNKKDLHEIKPIVGNWHTEDWTGLVLNSSEVLKETAELEENIVFDFLKNGFDISIKLLK